MKKFIRKILSYILFVSRKKYNFIEKSLHAANDALCQVMVENSKLLKANDELVKENKGYKKLMKRKG